MFPSLLLWERYVPSGAWGSLIGLYYFHMHSLLLRGLRSRAHSPTLSKKGQARPYYCPFCSAPLPPVMLRIW